MIFQNYCSELKVVCLNETSQFRINSAKPSSETTVVSSHNLYKTEAIFKLIKPINYKSQLLFILDKYRFLCCLLFKIYMSLFFHKS
jgi:hypothetical protein